MTSKRSISQSANKEILSQSKRSRTVDISNSLRTCLRESGLTLKHPPEKCIATQELILVVRNIKKNLQKHFDYPRNVSEVFSNLEKECQDLNIFKHFLFPNIVRITGDSPEEHAVTDSVIKLLLSVPILQNKLTDYIFERAIDLAADSKCSPWIQMILKCFSALDNIVDSEKLSTHLINLLDITTEKMVKLEIITALPDIIGDQEHANIASEMSRILNEDHDLIPAILDCLSYLCLSEEQYELLQNKTLSILTGLSKCCYFPNFVKFLLMPGSFTHSRCLEAVNGLRNTLNWPTTIAKPQEIASSQVLTAASMRNSMVSSKAVANAWLKVVSDCKVSTDHKPIDFIILLILSSTSEEKQKQCESLMRKQIKLEVLLEDLIDDSFQKYKPILKEYLKQLIDLNNILLKSKSDPEVEMFASHMYTLMLSELDDCCPTVVAELLQLGLDSKQCVMSILQILNNVASKDMSLLKPQCLQMLTLLDRMDDMSLTEVRAVMNLLCGLSYSYENSVIRDDIHMIIRKELSSSNPKIKIQGVVAGIHAVKYLIATNDNDDESRELPDDVSYGSVTYLSEGDLREAAQIIEQICRSTRQFPDMIAFFYDELSEVISSAPHINKHFMAWLTDAVTNDLQQNFIVDSIETDNIGGLRLSMQFCLNADSEMDELIAINIGGLALEAKSEVCVGILSSLFQLVQTLHSRQHDGNLSSIDALLGCSVVMPKYDIDLIEDMDCSSVSKILDCLIYSVNWFIELLNGFAGQEDDALRAKTLQRVVQIEELQTIIGEILLKTGISYKPPICNFDINKYTGDQHLRKQVKPQSSKLKQHKKSAPADDTAIPETAKSQATQNQISIRNRLETLHHIPMRHLHLSLLKLCCTDLNDNKDSETNLTVNTLMFLVKSINSQLENILVSKIKRKTFLTKKESVYDPKKAEECAKIVSKALPKFMEHLTFITTFINKQMTMNTQNENGFIFTSELIEHLRCLEYIYNFFTIYFKWIGFKNHHDALLKSSLRTIAQTEKPVISLKDMLQTVAKKLQLHENYCLQLTTAISLIELLRTIISYSDSKINLKILRDMANNFLSQQWKTTDGVLEKGLFFNQSVDKLAGIYFLNSEILSLKTLTSQLTHEIKLLKTRNDTLNTLKCVNKSNFTILYRNLGTALHETTKVCLNRPLTNSEHLSLWKDVTTILKHLSDIAKSLETRNNLSTFFKKSLPVLKLFLSQGIPILDMQLKNETQEVLEILKILQQSTRFLQSLCCHSRLKKDTALMSKVPYMRQLLETLIYKVKAALAANNCSEAFWMGNLKNKNIHGELIASQQSIESEESVEDGDDELPEDDSDDSDDEMINPDSKSLSDIV